MLHSVLFSFRLLGKASLFFCLIFGSVVALSDSVNVKRLNKSKWHSLESKHFQLISNGHVDTTLQIANELERFYFFVSDSLGYKQKALSQKVSVILAKNTKTFDSFGFNKSVAGIFLKGDGNRQPVMIAGVRGFKTSSSGNSWGRHVVLHELTHFIMNNADLKLANPPWFREGAAEYFATYKEKDGKIIIGDVSSLKGRFWSMYSKGGIYRGIDVESLFNFGKETHSTELSQQEVQSFYASSFAVVHYLNADPVRRHKLHQFLYALGLGYELDASYVAVFNSSYQDMDKAVDQYLGGRYMYARIVDIGGDGVKFPKFEFSSAKELEKRKALAYLINKINYFKSGADDEEKEKMFADAEALYPGIVEEVNAMQ